MPDFKRAATVFTDFAESSQFISSLSFNARDIVPEWMLINPQVELLIKDNIMLHHDAMTGTHSPVVDKDYLEMISATEESQLNDRISGTLASEI